MNKKQKRVFLNDEILGNPLWVSFTEMAMIHVGLQIMHLIAYSVFPLISVKDEMFNSFLQEVTIYSTFIIPIAFCVFYMYKTRKESLKVFRFGGRKQGLKAVGIGLLLGFIVNSVISLLVGISGSVNYTFRGFSWMMLAIFPFSFLQCTCEEVLLRGYVPAYLEKRHEWSSIAFISGTLFIFHHTGNLDRNGFSSLFCLNVFLIGVIFYLLVLRQRNFWISCGFHTAWNFTQEYLFGLPNSGVSSEFSLFQGNNATDSFFFNTAYGDEGSLCTTFAFIAILIYLIYTRKSGAKTITE